MCVGVARNKEKRLRKCVANEHVGRNHHDLLEEILSGSSGVKG